MLLLFILLLFLLFATFGRKPTTVPADGLDSPEKRSSYYAGRGVMALLLLFLAVLLPLMYSGVIRHDHGGGSGIKSIANCRQIILSMRLYAADHDGLYPDANVPWATDSNTVFRQLIVKGALEDEKVFGAGLSPFLPDGDIGMAPDYARAVEPGENHWAMTKGLNEKSPGYAPIVYENPVKAIWPPVWNAYAAGKKVKGRSWRGGKVIIGTNDTGVELMRLSSPEGTEVSLKPMTAGYSPFEQFSRTSDDTIPEVLDVAERVTK